MADKDESWSPKTREDWEDLFAAGTKKGLASFQSEIEEARAKGGNGDADKDKDGKDDNNGGASSKSFAERLLGL